jgi:hypothetical protein
MIDHDMNDPTKLRVIYDSAMFHETWDGVDQGVDTDTGMLMFICVNDHQGDERLNLILHRPCMKTLELEDQSTVSVDRLTLLFQMV